MKKILFLGILAFMLPFTSCNNEEEDDMKTFTVNFDDGDVELDAGEHLFYVTFFCDQPWRLDVTWLVTDPIGSPMDIWCQFSPTYGEAGNGKIRIRASKNTTEKKRKVELSLSSGTQKRTLKIIQNADPEAPITPVEPDEYDLMVDNIYYRLISLEDATLEVTGDGNAYQGDVVIPDNVEYKDKTFKVTTIKAFNNSPVTSVKIGNNVTDINNSFNYCPNLTSISIPASVKNMGGSYDHVFQNCANLSEFILEDGDEPIHIYDPNNEPFKNTPIKTLYWGRNCNQSFSFREVETISIGKKVTECPGIVALLGELTIPANVTTISGGISASKIIFENSNTNLEIGDAYADTIYLDRNLNIDNLFCSKSLITGNNVTYLYNISGYMESIDISSSVQFISGDLSSCGNLREITCRATTPPQIDDSFSDDTYFHGTLYVPEQSLSLYKGTSPWSNFIDIQPIK